MGRLIVAVVVFLITYSIVFGVLHFLFNIADTLVKLGVGAVIALIAAGIALSVAGGAAATTRT